MRSEARSQVRFVFGRKIKIVKFVKQGAESACATIAVCCLSKRLGVWGL